MKRKRNPRRSYDENGKELPPATVGGLIAEGYTTVMAYCVALDCFHKAAIPLEGWPLDFPMPDMSLRLRCSKCGHKTIHMVINVSELYAVRLALGRSRPAEPG